ncbi:hypothetical protein Pla175_48360 [Pirellulimonas nuda]|uniref:Squalene cyclase C-terminal domain-containing protein n=1 Tax=Pirellulimonas nuda TaxID=2528009 RepID=A0A518DIV8_9BACT|nr:hypothetical protein [Pirellulimonas nuda]QDU91413.1 hypothetical protein Pla175_48360 [Pirellulimonas nuda]
MRSTIWALALVGCWAAAVTLTSELSGAEETAPAAVAPSPGAIAPAEQRPAEPAKEAANETTKPSAPIVAKPVADFVQQGVEWLVKAQHNDGGWGGGSHAAQNVLDPHAVPTDPATTAFSLLALLRAGHTPAEGDHYPQVRKGLTYLVDAVEKADEEGPLITKIEGTQPQTKLGRQVDTALAAQYLARVLPMLAEDDALRPRVDAALDKCLIKLQQSQQADGSWGGGGGWAPVLQSSLGCSAMQLAKGVGKKVDEQVLDRAVRYQNGNVDEKSGRADASDAAGVELYAFNGAFRGNAAGARVAQDFFSKAVSDGRLEADAQISEETLVEAGAAPQEAVRLSASFRQNQAQIDRLGDETLLKGFGNNGGEEFLSYLMTSESLVIAGGDKFNHWNDKMHGRLQKVQNGDGSWSGHHCISSPVFCTAAVVQCLTTDRDAEFLVSMAKANDASKLSQAGK